MTPGSATEYLALLGEAKTAAERADDKVAGLIHLLSASASPAEIDAERLCVLRALIDMAASVERVSDYVRMHRPPRTQAALDAINAVKASHDLLHETLAELARMFPSFKMPASLEAVVATFSKFDDPRPSAPP